MYRCPWCGWEFDPYRTTNGTGISCFEMMPEHVLVVRSPSFMSIAALESGAAEEIRMCQGSRRKPVRCSSRGRSDMVYRCPMCEKDMIPLGCCTVTGLQVQWCVNCGTVKPCDQEPVAPNLAREKYPPADKPIIVQGKP